MYLKAWGKCNNKRVDFPNEYTKESYDKLYGELNIEYKYIVKINNNESIEYLKGDKDIINKFMEEENDRL